MTAKHWHRVVRIAGLFLSILYAYALLRQQSCNDVHYAECFYIFGVEYKYLGIFISSLSLLMIVILRFRWLVAYFIAIAVFLVIQISRA